MLMNGKIVYVAPFVPKRERIPGSDPEKFTNVYIKNLEPSFTEEDLIREFTKFGDIQNAVLMKDEKGNSRCFGFVNYKDHEAAKRAVADMDGRKFGEKEIFVGRAQKRGERESFLKKLREERAQKYQGINLYVKNLDDTINDQKLREAFSVFGEVTSGCRVMVDERGNSRGFGFVCFTNPDDASKAVTEMNGSMLAGKPIYVALAERKEVRRAKLEAQHAARAAARMTGTPNLASPVYPGTAVFYNPHQSPQQRQGFVGYPQGMPVPRRWGPSPTSGGRQQGYQPIPNYMVNPVTQRQGQSHRQNRGGQNMQGNGRNVKYTQNVRNQQSVPAQPVPGPQNPAPKATHAPDPQLTSALAAASPEERKNILGESLFPLIEEINPNEVSKITGMLLESLDVQELLHLLESPEALHSKVDEALEELARHALTGPTDSAVEAGV
jgi:polyadenylate-binding protein